MSGQEDAGRDAVALVQAALDHDEEALLLLLDNCGQRETCRALAAVAAHLVSIWGPETQSLLIGMMRELALKGQAVRLVSDGHRVREQAGA
jgi:hypothetical protein